VPVVTLIDPDGVISRHGLGAAVSSPEGLPRAVEKLLRRPEELQAASERCRAFTAREQSEVLGPYLAAFDEARQRGVAGSRALTADGMRRV
jgi:hypothetical protein